MTPAGEQVAARTAGPETRDAGWGGSGRVAISILLCLAVLGCSQTKERHEVFEVTAFPRGTVIAVAPALNFSGTSAFDPMVVGDLMASEVATLPDIGVIGVNRVVALLAEQGVARIQSPRHALDVCERLGADAIVVFAVTEYQPYDPPVVGITAQLYARRPLSGRSSIVADFEPEGPSSAPADDEPVRPAAEFQRVFNAAHERVRNEVQEYADKRSEGESPYGWRKYLASQELYIRFCCYRVARELLMYPTYGYGIAGG